MHLNTLSHYIPRIALKNITVYKLLYVDYNGTLYGPCTNHKYTLGETLKAFIGLHRLGDSLKFIVEEGLHSFVHQEGAKGYKTIGNEAVFEAVIPRGSIYFRGHQYADNQDPKLSQIVSSRLRVLKPVEATS
jgi:hypothetical protein